MKTIKITLDHLMNSKLFWQLKEYYKCIIDGMGFRGGFEITKENIKALCKVPPYAGGYFGCDFDKLASTTLSYNGKRYYAKHMKPIKEQWLKDKDELITLWSISQEIKNYWKMRSFSWARYNRDAKAEIYVEAFYL